MRKPKRIRVNTYRSRWLDDWGETEEKNGIYIPLIFYKESTGLFIGEAIKERLILDYEKFEQSAKWVLSSFGISTHIHESIKKTKIFYFPLTDTNPNISVEERIKLNLYGMEQYQRIWNVQKSIIPKFVYKEYNWMKVKKLITNYDINYEFKEVPHVE